MTTNAGIYIVGSETVFQIDNLSFDNGVTTLSNDGEIVIGSSLGNPVITTLSASNGVTITNGPGSIGISFNQANVVDPYTNVTFAMSPYTVLESDYFISVDTTAGAVSLVFPSTLVNRGSWIVKDRLGNAAVNNITLSTTGGYTIDTAATLVLNANFAHTQLFLESSNFELF